MLKYNIKNFITCDCDDPEHFAMFYENEDFKCGVFRIFIGANENVFKRINRYRKNNIPCVSDIFKYEKNDNDDNEDFNFNSNVEVEKGINDILFESNDKSFEEQFKMDRNEQNVLQFHIDRKFLGIMGALQYIIFGCINGYANLFKYSDKEDGHDYVYMTIYLSL